ncbi:MAG: hypothetical protein AAF658_02765, partial [Myxococcota bacterium]
MRCFLVILGVLLVMPEFARAEAGDPLNTLLVNESRTERRIQRGMRRWALTDRLRDGFAHTPLHSDEEDDALEFMRDRNWMDAIEQTLLVRKLRPRGAPA